VWYGEGKETEWGRSKGIRKIKIRFGGGGGG